MSGERKNTITKSATANTTTKKGLSQGQADILIAIVAMTWGCSYLLMKIGLTGMPPFSIIALRFCIAFITVALVFLPKMKLMNLRTLGYGSILGLLLFGVFAFLVPGMKYTNCHPNVQLLESFWLYLESACLHFSPPLQLILEIFYVSSVHFPTPSRLF